MEKYIVFDIETTGLRAHESNPITCICAKDSDGEWFNGSGEDEWLIMIQFFYYLRRKKDYKLISANGKDFDIPYLLIRAYLLGDCNYLSSELNREHFDIINDITFKRISLNDLAKIFGFELKTGNGLQAIKLYEEGKFNELIAYCSDDVKLTEKIYLKHKELINGKI